MGVCAILGVGPGNGMGFARRFSAAGDTLALCARDGARMAEAAAQFDGARGYACDVTDDAAVADTFSAIRSDLGPVSTVIYNAGSGAWGTFDQLTPDDLLANMNINAAGLMRTAQAAVPQFREAGGGNLVVVGASAALRGRAGTIAFAAGKAAQRSVAQSLARQLGPEGIHVSYLVIDGVIDIPSTRQRMPDKGDDFFLKPDAIADAVYSLTQQHPSAWTFELDIRPFGETW